MGSRVIRMWRNAAACLGRKIPDRERRECKRKAEKSSGWSSQARERGGIGDKVIVK